jgi:hypothetical protein
VIPDSRGRFRVGNPAVDDSGNVAARNMLSSPVQSFHRSCRPVAAVSGVDDPWLGYYLPLEYRQGASMR